MYSCLKTCTALLFLASALPVQAQVDSRPANQHIEEINIIGRPIEKYRATDALTGTKTAALLEDLPISITIVPKQLIEDRSIIHLGEALDSVSGAQRKPGYGGTQNFGAFIRGFDSSYLTLRNGLRDPGFYTLRDTANIERFEVLKGPSSVLYGAVFPGGITHTVTKKPTDERIAIAEFSHSEHGYNQLRLDLGGPISDSFKYRINISEENSDSFRDHVENKSTFIAPVIQWDISDQLSWTLEGEFKQAEYTWDLGLPRHQVVLELPIERFLGQPDSKNTVKSSFVSSRLDLNLSQKWLLRQNISYSTTDGDYELRSAWGVSPDNRFARRAAFNTQESSESIILQHELMGQGLELGNVTHQFIAGLEYYQERVESNLPSQYLAPLDLFNPDYRTQPSGRVSMFFDSDDRTDTYAFYIQDLIELNSSLNLLVGGRYDYIDFDVEDRLNQKTTRNDSDEAFSPQVGIVYKPVEGTSLYASLGQSFRPNNGTKVDGTFLDPEQGKQLEAGIKQSLLNDSMFLTFSTYMIEKSNVATTDPVNTQYKVQVGEQKSKGAEIDIVGSLSSNWSLKVTGAYVNAAVEKDNRFKKGSDLPGVPRWSGSIWNKYEFQQGALDGLSMGFGIYSAEARQVSLPNQVWRVPSYTRFDAMAAYQYEQWYVQLNVKNLSNKKIYDLTSTSIMPQEPRTLLLSVKYDLAY